MELDKKMWKRIRDEINAFRAYSMSVKNGKNTAKPELENWIDANIARYEAGRSEKANSNARAELGQWYTIFMTLASHKKILEHPCRLTSPEDSPLTNNFSLRLCINDTWFLQD
jgi:hypothetical protein